MDKSVWKLEEAKAKFSEVVRRASVQPQHVTYHGKPSVVVLSEEAYQKLFPQKKGSLYAFLQESPLDEVPLERPHHKMPVRDIQL